MPFCCIYMTIAGNVKQTSGKGALSLLLLNDSFAKQFTEIASVKNLWALFDKGREMCAVFTKEGIVSVFLSLSCLVCFIPLSLVRIPNLRMGCTWHSNVEEH